LTTTNWLNKNVHLQRAYFSAFNPIPNTPLENKPATNPLREHRLYQASFLLRDYGYDLEELPFETNGNLPLPADPKLIWAQVNLINQPLEINKADRNQLLRIPGIGPKSADSILKARREKKLDNIAYLRMLGIVSPDRAAPFLLFNGKRPAYQMSFL
jgi:predicted DNA-binding helix-hairpin-helix protein